MLFLENDRDGFFDPCAFASSPVRQVGLMIVDKSVKTSSGTFSVNRFRYVRCGPIVAFAHLRRAILKVLMYRLPNLAGAQTEKISRVGRSVRVTIRTAGLPAARPGCGTASRIVRSRYERRSPGAGERAYAAELVIRTRAARPD
jgi:hypothetical protein